MVEPYLFFGGRCDEALAFYKTAIGAQVEFVMRYDESPHPMPEGRLPAGFEKKVMHATLRVAGSVVMVSDGCELGQKYAGFSLSLSLPTQGDAKRAFEALSVGGSVTMPLTKTFWSPCFGMLTDQFGIGWMVTVVAK